METRQSHFAAANAEWSKSEEKAFEYYLAEFFDNSKSLFEEIAKKLPTKNMDAIKRRYDQLEEDIKNIESGRVPIPNYPDTNGTASTASRKPGKASSSKKEAQNERKKGIPWTEEEHRLFLLGLEKFGKGDWRSISRNFVVSRTPTQVASHAQKYFIRLSSINKRDKRRASIHDITSAAQNDISLARNNMRDNKQNKQMFPGPMVAMPPPSYVPGHSMR